MLRRTVSLVSLLFAATTLFGQTAQASFRISGKTVNALNGEPLARIEVSIGKAEDFNATLAKVLTEDDGAFTFSALAPGKYWMAAERNGYKRQGYEQHGGYLSAVAVGPTIASDNVIFRLRPDASITGSVVDEENEPVQNASIHLFRADSRGGFRQTFLAEQVVTDDRGVYRFAHLEAGWYLIAVAAQPWFNPLVQAAEGGDIAPADKAMLDIVYPITFYPGVTDPASAKQIVLNEGEAFTADFTLTAVPGLRLRLNHLNSDPEHPRGANLVQRVFGTQIAVPSQRVTQVDDSIEIHGIAPGSYVLNVESGGPRSAHPMALNIAGDMDFGPDDGSEPPVIRGSIKMEGGLNLQPQAFVRLWSNRTHEFLDAQINNGDFSFDPVLVAPGNYFVFVASGLYSTISKMSATGAKIVGQSVQITGAPIELNIELCNVTSRINGTVLRNGKPFPGAMILLVPEDSENNLPLFRRDQSDSDGTFSLLEVVPGRYRILAMDDGWDIEWADASLLKTRLDRSESIEVGPSKTYQRVLTLE